MQTYQELADTITDRKTYQRALRIATKQVDSANTAFKAAPTLADKIAADKDRKAAASVMHNLRLYYYDLVPEGPDYSRVLDML